MENTKKETMKETMKNRGSHYGEFTDVAILCQHMSTLVENADQTCGAVWSKPMNPVQREAMKMILTKIARICVGDANHADSWHDIQGYAKLVEDRL